MCCFYSSNDELLRNAIIGRGRQPFGVGRQMDSGRLWCSEGVGVVRDCAGAAGFTSTASGRLAPRCANGASSAGGMLITGHDWHQKNFVNGVETEFCAAFGFAPRGRG